MDTFVAPHYSAFTAATIPEVPVEDQAQEHWVANFLLNASLRARLDSDTQRAFYNFLRRAEAAYSEYGEARQLTIDHLADPGARRYIRAIGQWERFLSDFDRAWEVLVRGKPVLFEKNDGSIFQRLRRLYNCTKHIEFGDEPPEPGSSAILPVWLTNDGLEAIDAKMAFAEIADLLTDLAKWAGAVQDPITMREKLIATYGLSEEDIRPWGDQNR
jgi:hypothetical protein